LAPTEIMAQENNPFQQQSGIKGRARHVRGVQQRRILIHSVGGALGEMEPTSGGAKFHQAKSERSYGLIAMQCRLCRFGV